MPISFLPLDPFLFSIGLCKFQFLWMGIWNSLFYSLQVRTLNQTARSLLAEILNFHEANLHNTKKCLITLPLTYCRYCVLPLNFYTNTILKAVSYDRAKLKLKLTEGLCPSIFQVESPKMKTTEENFVFTGLGYSVWSVLLSLVVLLKSDKSKV